jgi:hypothetical protein
MTSHQFRLRDIPTRVLSDANGFARRDNLFRKRYKIKISGRTAS